MKEKLVELLSDEHFLERTIEGLNAHLELEGSDSFVSLVKQMNELEETGIVMMDEDNRFYLSSHFDCYIGTLSLNKKGYGFVTIEQFDTDIFVGADDLKGSYDGDTVFVQVREDKFISKKEARVLKILKRGKTKVVGILKKAKRDCYVESNILGLDKNIFIDAAHLHGAVVGHMVVVEIKTYKPTVKGNVCEVLGHKSDPGVDILAVLKEHDIDIQFPKDVFKQIDKIADEVSEEQLVGRTDLRNEVIVTIDGDDAKDLDDAISLKRLENGNYYLGVHIADVSYYVTEDSPLDKEAVNRGTSIYLVDRVVPMLPHKLSNGICSLNPHVDRLTISCFMEIDHHGHVINHEIVESVIHSTHRMTYNNVNKILAGDKQLQEQYHDVIDLFFLMAEVAKILQDTKARRGAIDFDVKEAKVLVDKKGKVNDIVLRTRGTSDRIIEEFMLLANETVAKHFEQADLPFIYRVHEHPKVNKLQKFQGIAKALGYTIEGSLEDVTPVTLSQLVEDSKGTPEHEIIATLLLRCMQKARYDENCLGHYGLADDYYTHFTSPIRRYPDLLVHRLIRTYLFEKQTNQKTIEHFETVVPVLAEKSSMRERIAITVERDVEDMKKAEFMEQYIGKEFEGTISSVTNFGLFVELDNTIEGLVHVSELSDDYYFFDENNLQYIGQRTGTKFRMSDEVKIKVTGASKKEKQIDFNISGMKKNNPRRKHKEYKKDSKKTSSRRRVHSKRRR